ncbi:Similarity with Glyoxalase/Bleomycin resistance protein [Mycobacteroides abscessus subsp. abscessus]|uniref:VOC family protein n=1 Tax=Mycobacteroides abscessus TaxID=36809 RepID=UPI00092AF278|nr:VOC family protein [Mycobacteroides abscessus]SIK20914.1 Similarity with Glyoxalase/Bleomycin resistance protein [Mycobacteroides abscessus subsp. abscessus]SLE61759.1 Similarity with Glyoxalase/Bleomycin resistance protein [Mycobacteroides abscessus subsp. abscessus]
MTTSTPSVWLTLKAKDAPALIEYYVDTFGFLLAARYGEGDRVDHAQLNWPEGTGGIMLGSHRPGGEWALEPGTAGAYVVTRDADGLYQRIVAKKADIVRPLAKTDYGAHEFAVRDPEGNLWSFGDYTGEPAPE